MSEACTLKGGHACKQVGDYAESLEKSTEVTQEGAFLGAVEGTPPAPVQRRNRRQTYLALPADQLIAHLGGLGSSGYIHWVSLLKQIKDPTLSTPLPYMVVYSLHLEFI